LRQPEKSNIMRIETTMYSLVQYFRIAISNNATPTLFQESGKNYMNNLWVRCSWHHILLGRIFGLWEDGGWIGEGGGEFESKIGLFYSVTSIIVYVYIGQMCVNESYVCDLCVW